MTNLKSTLDSALPAGAEGAYYNEYRNVLEALTERDYRLTDQITDVVTREFSINRNTVREQLALAGMAVRPAPATVPQPTDEDLAEWEKALLSPEPVSPEPFVDTEAIKSKKEKKGKKSDLDKLAKQVKRLTKLAKDNGYL